MLLYRVKVLTQELKNTSSKLRYHGKKIQQDSVSCLIAKNSTLIYRSF